MGTNEHVCKRELLCLCRYVLQRHTDSIIANYCHGITVTDMYRPLVVAYKAELQLPTLRDIIDNGLVYVWDYW